MPYVQKRNYKNIGKSDSRSTDIPGVQERSSTLLKFHKGNIAGKPSGKVAKPNFFYSLEFLVEHRASSWRLEVSVAFDLWGVIATLTSNRPSFVGLIAN